MHLRFKTITIFGNFKTAVALNDLPERLLRGSPLQKETEDHMTDITIAEVIVPKEIIENQKHKVK